MLNIIINIKDIYSIAIISALAYNMFDLRSAILFALPAILLTLAFHARVHIMEQKMERSQLDFITHMREQMVNDMERRDHDAE